MKASIGKKMISATLVMLILVLTMSLVSIWSVQRVGKGGDIILKASTYICLIQDLRLSFERILMPPHDYLIFGNPNEVHEFKRNIQNLKQALDHVSEIIKPDNYEWMDARKSPFVTTADGIVKIEALANDIFSVPDPLGLEAGKLMKQMDAKTEQIKQDLEELIKIVSKDKDSKILDSTYEFMISFQSILMPPHDYLILGDNTEQENYNVLLPILSDHIKKILRLSRPGHVERQIIKKVIDDFEVVQGFASQILAIKDPLRLEAAKKMKMMDATADHVIMQLDTLLGRFKKDAEMDKNKADRIKSYAIHFVIIISLILVVGGLIAGLVFSSNITDPVRQLLQATQRISAGDLTHKAQVKTKDEIGELAKSFNRMTEDLRTYRAQLIHAKEYIDNIIKSMIDTLIVVNPDGNIHTVNKATIRLLKYKQEGDLIGKPIEKIFAKDAALFRGKKMQGLIKEGSIRNYDTVYETKDGIEIPINLSASVMRDKDGSLLGTVCVARDMREINNLIKDLKKAYKDLQSTQSQLIQSSKLVSMGVLAAGVAHEINNPMNIIINYAGLLEDELDPGTEHANYVQGILKEGQRITNIVKNLLAFGRTDKQAHNLCKIKDVINTSLTFMKAYLERDAIKVQTEYSPDLPKIMARFSQLEQVFINLILNAMDTLNEKYPQPDPKKLIRIEVNSIEKDNIPYIRIFFIDHGGGIPREYLDKIFDPFFTTKRAGKGTGLGLSISYGIIADHKGSIEVKTEDSKQTTFIIDLPTQEGWSKLEG